MEAEGEGMEAKRKVWEWVEVGMEAEGDRRV